MKRKSKPVGSEDGKSNDRVLLRAGKLFTEDEFNAIVGRVLASVLAQEDLSVSKAAEMSGVDRAFIQEIQAGRRKFSVFTLFRLATQFDQATSAGLIEKIDAALDAEARK